MQPLETWPQRIPASAQASATRNGENGIALERIGPRDLAGVDRRLARKARGVDDEVGPGFAQKFAENGGIGVVVRRARGSFEGQPFRVQVGREATADIAVGAQE